MVVQVAAARAAAVPGGREVASGQGVAVAVDPAAAGVAAAGDPAGAAEVTRER
ncbi:MAG TPA: hypothetical protein VMN35_01060 [Gaiellaceae bacterium]|nr:hypothetical protein [Gaiellaceae bacterium]